MTLRIAGRKFFVTGATGFVGSALAGRLTGEGARVVGLSRQKPGAVRSPGIEWVTGDLEDRQFLLRAMRGVDAVFHVGGMVGQYGSRDVYMRANVDGTRNIIDACRANAIPTLIFTSTPSVIADGTPHFGIDETHPYSKRFQSPYSESKALAEQLVRGASGDDLRTVCIRPHMIWGPGPSHWVGGLRKRAHRGTLFQLGDGDNRVGMTYLDDCIDAHLAACGALERDPAVSGEVFFVHGGEPVRLWDWVRELTAALGLPGIRARIPRRVAAVAAGICDALATATRGSLHFPISGYLVTELTTDHYSRIDKAKRMLDWQPAISVPEGIARLAAAEPGSVIAGYSSRIAPSALS